MGINLTHRPHYPGIDPSIATERIPSLTLICKPVLSVPPPALALYTLLVHTSQLHPPVWNVFAPVWPLTHAQRDFPDCLLATLTLLPPAMYGSSTFWLLWPLDLSFCESILADFRVSSQWMTLIMSYKPGSCRHLDSFQSLVLWLLFWWHHWLLVFYQGSR